MDMVSSQTAGHLTKGHCGSIWCHRIGLDREGRTHIAPELEQVMGHTHQMPLTPDVVQAAQQKPAEATRFFDLAKHRFHDHFAPGVQRASSGCPYFRRHALLGGGGWLHLLSLRGMVALPARGPVWVKTSRRHGPV